MKPMKPIKFSTSLPAQLAALVDAPDSIKSDTMRAALAKIQQDAAEKDVARTIQLIETANGALNRLVDAVRDIRKKEKAAIAKLKAYSAAFDAFKQTGDFDTFQKKAQEVAYMP